MYSEVDQIKTSQGTFMWKNYCKRERRDREQTALPDQRSLSISPVQKAFSKAMTFDLQSY